MIGAIVKKNKDHYLSFSIEGHAGFARKGKDIVCAAVSILVINTINSIEQFTNVAFEMEHSEDGYVSWKFTETTDDRVDLLMDSMILGLQQIESQNSKFFSLEIEEV